jgi:hypothetical protein
VSRREDSLVVGLKRIEKPGDGEHQHFCFDSLPVQRVISDDDDDDDYSSSSM